MYSCTQFYIQSYFDNVVMTYESKYLQDFNYKKYDLHKNGMIFVVEDSFILYCCIEHIEPDQFHVKLEELLPNDIFAFNITKFLENFDNAYYLLFYKKFYGFNNKMQKSLIDRTTFDTIKLVNTFFPELNILQRVQGWKGFLYNIVYFEINSGENVSYAITWSQKEGGYSFAYKKCQELEKTCLQLLYEYRPFPNKNYFYVDGILFDNKAYSTIEQITKQKPYTLFQKVRFWCERDFFSDVTDDITIKKGLLNKISHDYINSQELFLYKKKLIKWKSEYSVYELTKKIYGNSNVMFQYRPYYLNQNGHQLSYDIYIPKIKTAIEYQGQQHFEPIDYFGRAKVF